MTISANTLEKLLAAGLSGEQLLEVVRSIEADIAPRERSAGARRQAEYRARQKAMKGDGDATGDVTGDVTNRNAPPLKESSPLHPPKENTPPYHPTEGARKPTPRDELEAVLDAEHADAVLEHRQRLRKPLTARAARMLAGKLAAWRGGANQAADAMIAAGWQGFEPEWLEGRKVAGFSSSGSAASSGNGGAQAPPYAVWAEHFARTGQWRDEWPRRRDIPAEFEALFAEAERKIREMQAA